MQSKLGWPLSRAIAHNDVDQIVELYRQRGYFDVKVDPQTIKHKSGRATLVFVIMEGDKLAVRQVQFAGNEAFSATKLKDAIKTGESNVLSFVTDNDTYNADQIESRPRPHSPLLSEQRLRRRTRAQFGQLSGRQKGRRRHFHDRGRTAISFRQRGYRFQPEIRRPGSAAIRICARVRARSTAPVWSKRPSRMRA